MDLKSILKTLEDLESRELLNPSEAISEFGYEKVSEVLALMHKAKQYNIPESYYLTFLEELRKPSSIKPISYPAIEVDNTPVPTVGVNHFLISEEVMDVLRKLSKEGLIKLSTRDIAILSGCDPNNMGTVRKISATLELEFSDNMEFPTDPTRVSKTRTKVFEVDLNRDFSGEVNFYEELNGFLSSRKEEVWNQKLPIILVDYLSGQVKDFVFFCDSEQFSFKPEASLVSKFVSVFKKNYCVAHTLENANVDVIPRSPINLYLLDRALKQSFPVTSVEEMVEELATPYMTIDHRKELCAYIREEMSKIEVSVGVDSDKNTNLDTNLSGFTYLIAYSMLSEIISQGGLPQPF